MKKLPLFLIGTFLTAQAFAATELRDEGSQQGYINVIDCVGSGVSCSKSGIVGTVNVAGGAGSPGGSNTQVQINDSGSFGGDSGLTFNKTFDWLTVGGRIGVGNGNGYTISADGNSTYSVQKVLIISSDTGAKDDLQIDLSSQNNNAFIYSSTGGDFIQFISFGDTLIGVRSDAPDRWGTIRIENSTVTGDLSGQWDLLVGGASTDSEVGNLALLDENVFNNNSDTDYAFVVTQGSGTHSYVKISGEATITTGSTFGTANNDITIDPSGSGKTNVVGNLNLSSLSSKTVLYSDSSNNISSLSAGSNGQVLSSDPSQSAGIKWSSITQHKVFMNFPVQSAKLSGDNAVRIDAGLNGGATPYTVWRLLFASTDSTMFSAGNNVALWQGRMDDNWQGGPLTAKIDYAMVSSDSTSGVGKNIQYGVSIWAITSGDAASMTTESYGTENTKTQGIPSVISRDETVSIPLTNIDSLAPGDWFMVKLRRVGNFAGATTGDAAVISFALTE